MKQPICEVHQAYIHRPLPLEVERHHPVPRAWQAIYTPAKAPFPGQYGGQALWDSRVVMVPPTCHRNVHHWIVLLMHELAELIPASSEPNDQGQYVDAAAAHVAKVAQIRSEPQAHELDCAKLAPARFLEAGGDLLRLISLRAWGEA